MWWGSSWGREQEKSIGSEGESVQGEKTGMGRVSLGQARSLGQWRFLKMYKGNPGWDMKPDMTISCDQKSL